MQPFYSRMLICFTLSSKGSSSVEDAGAVPVLDDRTLERSLKSSKKDSSKKDNSKKTAAGQDVCDLDGDMDLNNALMSVMKMEDMDEMEMMFDTMNILAPAVKAVRDIMEEMQEQGGGDTSDVTDLDIVESMLSPPVAPTGERDLQEMKTTLWSGERNLSTNGQAPSGLTPSQQASWSMAYYSLSIVLMNAGYNPDPGPLTSVTRRGNYFDFAEVVADYICSDSSVSASFFSASKEIAMTENDDLATAMYEQFASIFQLLGIGRQLALARRQDALGPLSSNSAISRLCGRLIACFNSGASTTQAITNKRVSRGEADYNGAFADFAANMCKLKQEAGTRLTIHGSGASLAVGTSPTGATFGPKTFTNGAITYTGLPIGQKLYIQSYGQPSTPSQINKITFESCTASAHSLQTFYSLNEFDSFSFYSEPRGGSMWNELLFNPRSVAADTVLIGDGPVNRNGGNNAKLSGAINGNVIREMKYLAKRSSRSQSPQNDLESCQNFFLNFYCHSFTTWATGGITKFSFNADKATNFRGISVRKGVDHAGSTRFFFRYGNVGFNPFVFGPGEKNIVPAVDTGEKKWVYEDASVTF
jgi:hypothetical protein